MNIIGLASKKFLAGFIEKAASSWMLQSLALGIHTKRRQEKAAVDVSFPSWIYITFHVPWDYYPHGRQNEMEAAQFWKLQAIRLRCWNNGYYLRFVGRFEPRSQWARGVDYLLSLAQSSRTVKGTLALKTMVSLSLWIRHRKLNSAGWLQSRTRGCLLAWGEAFVPLLLPFFFTSRLVQT